MSSNKLPIWLPMPKTPSKIRPGLDDRCLWPDTNEEFGQHFLPLHTFRPPSCAAQTRYQFPQISVPHNSKIIIPTILPSLISSCFFAFLGSFDEFMISLFLAGVGQRERTGFPPGQIC